MTETSAIISRPVASVADAKQIKAPTSARAILEIDLNALRANWAKLNEVAGEAECAGVVKADAYGLGLEEITAALAREGCKTFFAATIHEAQRVRAIAAGATIYVLDGLLADAEEQYAGFDLRPVLSSLPEIHDWATFCKSQGRRRPAALHVDTGMNRLGLPASEISALLGPDSPLQHFEVALVMSHLYNADVADGVDNPKQLAAFQTALDKLIDRDAGTRASLANSGGTFLGPDYHFDLVRPGIALYGGRAIENKPNPMQPVVRLRARILQVRTVNPGEIVGYGGTFQATTPTRIATIACGYADGFLRALSGDRKTLGPVGYIGEHPVRIVGRVSMDLITIDVSNVPEDLTKRGAWVEVMGARVTVDDLTDRAGTIGYELLSRLSNRVHRIYIEGRPA
ncbi:MAG: alanine racemase [Hyphomicrobiaceae bacterium]